MKNFPLPRLDEPSELHDCLLPYCRLREGEFWTDGVHTIGCMDAANTDHVKKLTDGVKSTLAIHDPPYNLIAFEERSLQAFIEWCSKWIENSNYALADDAALYLWLGADQTRHYQPLPDVMLMMRETNFQSRSLLTMRNQRGYGTQKNWMAVRQELLYYTKGNPAFNIEAEYTDIPKILRGYYKEVNGEKTENLERSKSENIRAGNVWVDVQQVFYRMEENVNGCYAQKPLKSIERIIRASSSRSDVVLDFFAHSGTTLIAAEMLGRRCFTMDIDPIFCEITIRRLELYRSAGKTGWQNGNPFEREIMSDSILQELANIHLSSEASQETLF
jgi:site-specific DNA-methyltransferase (adenine-specific)